jgi:hypothetical protein
MIRFSSILPGIFAACALSACASASGDASQSAEAAYTQNDDSHWVGKFQTRGGDTNTLNVFAVENDYVYFALSGKDFFGRPKNSPIVGRARFKFIDDAAEYENGSCKLEIDKFFDDKRIDPDLSTDCGGFKWSDLVGFYNTIPGNPLAGSFTKKGASFWDKDAQAELTPSDSNPKTVHVKLSSGDKNLEGDASLALDERGAHLELRHSRSCVVEVTYGADAVTVAQSGWGCGWREVPSELLGTFSVPDASHF